MNNAERTAGLEAQIKLRLEILREWVRRGVPSGYVIPKSLTKIRLWKDAQLGISAIGSSSSFTKSHDKYGRYICEIAKVLETLQVKNKKQAKVSKLQLQKQLRSKNDDYKAALTAAANKYVMQKVATDDAERQVRVLQQSQKELEAQLRELKQKSVRPVDMSSPNLNNDRANNVTKIEFRKARRDGGKKRR